jgi:Domain of unknown function (DUF4375)
VDKNQLLIMLSVSERTAFGREDFSEQSLPQKVFSTIWEVESEVMNGGFSQYFLNSSCETAGFVVEAMNQVGASKTASICRRAIETAFPEGLPADPEEISSAAANFSETTEAELAPLDQEFFSRPDDLTELLFAFVSKHPQEFGELA